jgi:hypothetical protein
MQNKYNIEITYLDNEIRTKLTEELPIGVMEFTYTLCKDIENEYNVLKKDNESFDDFIKEVIIDIYENGDGTDSMTSKMEEEWKASNFDGTYDEYIKHIIKTEMEKIKR